MDAGPTIFIECTHTFHSDLNTGIQRVVRNVLRHASAVASELGYSVVPVILQNDRLVPADLDVVLSDKQAQAKPRRPPSRYDRQRHGARETATARRHLYLTLRPAWRAFLRLASALAPSNRAREFIYAPPYRPGLTQSILRVAQTFSGGTEAERLPTPHVEVQAIQCRGYPVVAELVVDRAALAGGAAFQGARRSDRRGHLRHNPHIAPVPSTPELSGAFARWLQCHLQYSDVFLAISKSVADQLRDYLGSSQVWRGVRGLPRIRHFHLGSELDFLAGAEDVRQHIVDIFGQPEHVFLMVGSLEPRKNHGFVLDAFERFWAAGGQASLVIVGRQGWKTEDLLQRIAHHRLHQKRLFLLRDVSDAELDHAYRSASALVIASEIEGFGLPVVEAFQRGLPVLCSDIPVFREIADGQASFFRLDDPDRLTAVLHAYCRGHDPARRSERTPRNWLTWKQSTEQLFANLIQALDAPAEPLSADADAGAHRSKMLSA